MAAGADSLESIVLGLHHVAIVVRSIDEVRATYEGVLGMSAGEPETVSDQGVRVLVCRAGAQRIELVEPISEGSPVSGFLRRRGEGLHHLAYRVRDLELALQKLRGAGLALIDESPRSGANGTRVAFVHPRATHGVLTELVEDPRPS